MADGAHAGRLSGAEFKQKVDDRDLTVAIVGLGYVGLPLLMRFREVGFPVIGLDASDERVDLLSEGRSPIRHIADSAVQTLIEGDDCRLTSDYSALQEADAVIVCVPTPLTANRTPDMTYVADAAEALRPHFRPGQVVALESTVYPGATEEFFLPALEAEELVVGRDIFLAYSPEREDPGNARFSAHNTPKVCGGHTEACLERASYLYGKMTDQVVEVSSMRTAEMTKLLENIHRCVNIGLVNEMKIVADRMDINIHEVISAAATKPFGFTAYWPGPGLGGHCIPIDPFYMTWKAREYGIDTRFIELAGQVNSAMPEFVVSKVLKALNDASKSVKGSRILICGLAYKKNIDDLRESPALEIIHQLLAMGADVVYDDRYVTDLNRHEAPQGITQVDAEAEGFGAFDCVVITTDHDYYDYARIQREAPAVVDTRGRYRKVFDSLYCA